MEPVPRGGSVHQGLAQLGGQRPPDVPRGLLVEGVPADWLARLQALGCVSLHCRHDMLDAALARCIKEAGYGLMCYTVNDPDRARELFSWGVDAICTDRYDIVGVDLY